MYLIWNIISVRHRNYTLFVNDFNNLLYKNLYTMTYCLDNYRKTTSNNITNIRQIRFQLNYRGQQFVIIICF